jgi:hypothetical protein
VRIAEVVFEGVFINAGFWWLLRGMKGTRMEQIGTNQNGLLFPFLSNESVFLGCKKD